jgi:hypothetical protein
MHTTDTPERTLARDPFTARRRELSNHPEAVQSSARIDVEDPYGEVETWVLDLFRVCGEVTGFVQRIDRHGSVRLLLPPTVAAAIARHQGSLVTKARRRVAQRVVADRRARGEKIGNPDALRKARKSRKTA